MEKNINELLLKPDEVKSYDGWKKINGLKKAFTNVTERNYGYLASMLGVKDVEAKAMTGVKYIRIGERAVNGDRRIFLGRTALRVSQSVRFYNGRRGRRLGLQMSRMYEKIRRVLRLRNAEVYERRRKAIPLARSA